MVAVAEANASWWTSKRHKGFPTNDIELPTRDDESQHALHNISAAVRDRVWPLLRTSFSLPEEAAELHFRDLFLVRYHPAGQSELDMHRDGSTLSFSIALSPPDAYEGGGIEFELLPTGPIRTAQGALVLHPSRLSHRGAKVVGGSRYVLVGFVVVGYHNYWTSSMSFVDGSRAQCVQVDRGEGEPQGRRHCHSVRGLLSGLGDALGDEDDVRDLALMNGALLGLGLAAYAMMTILTR